MKERNDFLELVEEYPDTVTQEDLKLLLKQRLEIPSKFLTASLTAFISLLIGFTVPMLVFYQILSGLGLEGLDWYIKVTIVALVILSLLLIIFIRETIKRSEKEKRFMEQYLQAKKRLGEIKTKEAEG